jgi:hypothetical protein
VLQNRIVVGLDSRGLRSVGPCLCVPAWCWGVRLPQIRDLSPAFTRACACSRTFVPLVRLAKLRCVSLPAMELVATRGLAAAGHFRFVCMRRWVLALRQLFLWEVWAAAPGGFTSFSGNVRVHGWCLIPGTGTSCGKGGKGGSRESATSGLVGALDVGCIDFEFFLYACFFWLMEPGLC